jgi:hypothetical protein
MTTLTQGEIAIQHTNRLHKTEIGRFDAVFAKYILEKEVKADAKYVRIDSDEYFAVLKLKSSDGKDAIFVSEGTLTEIKDNVVVSWKSASFRDFFFYKLRNDKGQRLLTLGLLLAIIGTLIDGSFAIGKMDIVLFSPPDIMTNFLVFLALALKVVGLAIAFYKTILEGK